MVSKLLDLLLKIGLTVSFGKLTPNLKLIASYIRYYAILHTSSTSQHKKVFFIAALPKSGSTWLENIIADLTQSSLLMPIEVSRWEKVNGRSDNFIPKSDFIKKLPRKRWVLKLHCKSSKQLLKILKNNNIKPIILYRDISEIFESHYYYVSNTKFHSDFKYTIKKNKNESIEFLKKKYEQDYKDWIKQWKKYPDAIVVSYNEMLLNPYNTIQKISKKLNIECDDKMMKNALSNNTLEKMMSRSVHKAFYRGSRIKK